MVEVDATVLAIKTLASPLYFVYYTKLLMILNGISCLLSKVLCRNRQIRLGCPVVLPSKVINV